MAVACSVASMEKDVVAVAVAVLGAEERAAEESEAVAEAVPVVAEGECQEHWRARQVVSLGAVVTGVEGTAVEEPEVVATGVVAQVLVVLTGVAMEVVRAEARQGAAVAAEERPEVSVEGLMVAGEQGEAAEVVAGANMVEVAQEGVAKAV